MNERDWQVEIERFRSLVRTAAAEFARVSDEEASHRPAPGKWTHKEIVGHLIDSASNNHQRFVRARLQESLVFPGYEQDEWVREERWDASDWREIVALWRGFNLHLAHVMITTSADVRDRVRILHNFDEIAFKELPPGEPATLGWFMRDYVDHLEHHLIQAGAKRTSHAQ